MNQTPIALNRHVLFTEHRSVVQLCKPLKHLHIPGFIYMRRFADGSFIDLSNQLDWSNYFLERYLAGLYDLSVIQDHMFLEQGVSLWQANPENIIWQEGIEHFGYGNGISIVKSGPSAYTEIFCFYAQAQDTWINAFYLTHLDLLKQFCDYFVQKATPVIERAKHLQIPSCYHTPLETPQAPTDAQIDTFLRTIDPHRYRQQHTVRLLSPQEKRCIEHCLQGQSAKTIARQLGISHRTVESHLNHAKHKLGCANLCELVAVVAKHTDT